LEDGGVTIGEKLDRARKLPRKGYPDTFHKLKTGRTGNPHPTTVRSIEEYIRKAERAHARFKEAK
jgi:hypothetical protein